MYLFTSQPRHQKLDLPWFAGSVAASHLFLQVLAEKMELVKELANNQVALYLLPTALVIVVVILVYTFGFKSAEQPPFDKLTNDDRKQAGKKKKIKEKKATANGHVSTGDTKTEKSPVKDSKRSPTKDTTDVQKQKDKKLDNKQVEKNKKNEAIKNKVIEEVKNKKNIKKLLNEKPVDFDDGNWKTVPSKADKKKKAEQSPAKKDKKNDKKTEKAAEIEKLVKEVVNKELREKEKEVKVEKPVEEKVENEEPVVIIEEKKEKKKEKKAKKEEKPEKPVIEKEVPVQKEVPKPKVEIVVQEEGEEEPPKPPVKEGGVVFDELGDVWTEAKAAKKSSKKKARRDN